MRILGVDPGSLRTGYGVIDVGDRRLEVVAFGVVAPPAGLELCDRLTHIAAELSAITRLHAPEAIAIESVFTARSPRSALVLGQARGAAMVAVGSVGKPVFEVAPARVKSLVAGHGRASKTTVSRCVRDLLKITGKLGSDASDALAIALSVAFQIPPRGATVPPVRVRRVSARKAWNDQLRGTPRREKP